METPEKTIILNSEAVQEGVSFLAEQIERISQGNNSAIIGIRTRGMALAERLVEQIDPDMPMGVLDITLYRDDLAQRAAPLVRGTHIDFDLEGLTLFLVDDVLFTGRTIRSALTALADFGRPKSIRLVTLIDRGHQELPIRPDFCYKTIKTNYNDSVKVHLTETDDLDEVVLIKQSGGA